MDSLLSTTTPNYLHMGTSSWNFSEWHGVFYPETLPKTEQLAYYARHFNSVEVNTSFYALPKPATLIQWVETVPPGFTFALKTPREITHRKRLVNCQSEMRAYLDAVRSLGAAAAPGFLQLPPSFTRANGGRALADFLDWVPGVLDGVRLAVEVRSSDLMTPAFARFLAERGLILAVVIQDEEPDLFPVWQALLQAEDAPRLCFVRWIGNRDRDAVDNRTLTAPRDDMLDLWAERIQWLAEQQIEFFGYMHNPFEGHSPASLRRLFERLAPHVSLPQWPPADWSPPAGDDTQLSLFEE